MFLEILGAMGAICGGYEAIRVNRQGADLYGLHDGASQFGLDAISGRKLREALKCFDPGMTGIMVAHRLNRIRTCDHILVMDKGTLAEEGTHAQLMERNGLYAAMYTSMN